MSKDLQESALDAILSSYFSADNVQKLSSIYISILSNLPQLDQSRKSDLLKCVLSFLLTFLVEQGQIDLTRSWPAELESKKNSHCQIENLSDYCGIISDKGNSSKWTHMLLLITGDLRINKFAGEDVGRISNAYIAKVRLCLYGVLLQRLALDLTLTGNSREREEIQSLLFFTIVYFYSDYIDIKKSPLDATRWDSMYETIVKSYLGNEGLFSGFSLGSSLVNFIDQDVITGVKGCIDYNFIAKYSISGFEYPSTFLSIKCLKGINLNSWSKHFNQWFRSLVESRVVNVTLNAGSTIVNNIIFSADVAFKSGKFIYSNDYPVAAYLGSVAIGLVAFTGAFGSLQIVNAGSMTFSSIKSAIVYAFKKKSLVQTSEEIRFSRPRQSARLIWAKSQDGIFSSMFMYYPLPQAELEGVTDFKYNSKSFKSQSGGRVSRDLKIQTKFTASDEIINALKKGYLKQELCVEMQEFISKRLRVPIQLGGGGEGEGEGYSQFEEFIDQDLLEDHIYNGKVSFYTLQVAEDVCEIISLDDEYKLILPNPAIVKEAFEDTTIMDIPSPVVDLSVLTGSVVHDQYGDELLAVASPFTKPTIWEFPSVAPEKIQNMDYVCRPENEVRQETVRPSFSSNLSRDISERSTGLVKRQVDHQVKSLQGRNWEMSEPKDKVLKANTSPKRRISKKKSPKRKVSQRKSSKKTRSRKKSPKKPTKYKRASSPRLKRSSRVAKKRTSTKRKT